MRSLESSASASAEGLEIDERRARAEPPFGGRMSSGPSQAAAPASDTARDMAGTRRSSRSQLGGRHGGRVAPRPCGSARLLHRVVGARAWFRSCPRSGPRPPLRSRPRRSRGGRPGRCLSLGPPSLPYGRGEPVGKRHGRIRALGTTGHVAGAATEKSGSKRIAQETACPSCVLPRAPVPVGGP
jgi:hypothetical protein